MNRILFRSRAFTLIELLVVVAIIALLLSILLPSLQRAKEQGRIAVCMSNLRTISSGAVSYMMENDDIVFAFPFNYVINGSPINFGLITEFIWGGGIPDKTQQEYTAVRDPALNAYNYQTDIFMVRPKDRPLNKFMSAEVSWDQPERVGRTTPARTARKMDLPGFFKCPSDRTAWVPLAGTPSVTGETDSPYRTWEFYGTSYASNWYWPYYYSGATPGNPLGAPPGNIAPYNRDFGAIVAGIGTGPNRCRSLGRTIMKDKSARWAAEFILFYENRMNYAMNNARPRGIANPNARKDFIGWHGQRDFHGAGFLDGSARYARFDTRFVDGPGWTTWPNKPWAGASETSGPNTGWGQYNDD